MPRDFAIALGCGGVDFFRRDESGQNNMQEFLKAVMPRRVLNALRALKHGSASFEVEPLLGMTGTAERTFFAECAEGLRDSPGALVDLGCWMGSTCLSLARGLGDVRADGRQPGMVFAFDRFIWEDWMNDDSRRVYCDYLAGDCFLPEVRRRTQAFRDRITLIQADLTRYVWDRGEIKLLLVDAMKTAELAQAIARSFYPSLQSGAILIHQDYKHYYTPWIHILQYRLRAFFRFVRSVPGGTVAFAVTERISRTVVEQASDFTSVEDKEADAAFEYSLGLVGAEGRASVAAAHVMHFVHGREQTKARERLSKYQEPGLASDREFARALQQITMLEEQA